ncbi:MAG: hypothetical protein V1702_02945 [Candidatus Woesearchaeota archaeon]
MKAAQILKEWAMRYVKNRVSSLEGIIATEEQGNSIIMRRKDGSATYVVEPVFDIKTAKKGITIVALSNSTNIDAIAKNWGTLSKLKGMKIILANPFSTQEERWSISPEIHNRICDRKTLKLGLKAMAELVDPITEKEIEAK